jgi:hypothetical protein
VDHKRGRDDDEDDKQAGRGDGVAKRHRASGTGERFSQTREGEEYQGHAESEQGCRYGYERAYEHQAVSRHRTCRYNESNVHEGRKVETGREMLHTW